jgi:RHS repeat-associated protein
MQGAGGVGGLLEVSDYGSSTTTNCFAAFDGNGNLAALVNAANGTTLANYEYGPFGEVIRQTGPMATTNPFRFSTKYQDDESDLLYYGYRYYKASTGDWLSRDPIGEAGGRNLYGLLGNDPINIIDAKGLKGLCGCKCKKVKFGTPGTGLSVSGTAPNWYVGIKVPYTIEVEGDPMKCHCSYFDDGTIKAVGQYKNGEPIDISKNYDHVQVPTDGGCVSGVDSPGFNLTTGAPDGGFSANVTVTYNWTGTVVCQDSDGTIFDSTTLNETDSQHVNSPNRPN